MSTIWLYTTRISKEPIPVLVFIQLVWYLVFRQFNIANCARSNKMPETETNVEIVSH